MQPSKRAKIYKITFLLQTTQTSPVVTKMATMLGCTVQYVYAVYTHIVHVHLNTRAILYDVSFKRGMWRVAQ
jgi:hypothetical protein